VGTRFVTGLGHRAGAGFASVTVACEPTGHRWRVLDQLAAEWGLPLVCVDRINAIERRACVGTSMLLTRSILIALASALIRKATSQTGTTK
jgi:hypothetical protein